MRAAVFHLGVLRRLANEERLEHVAQISTVSGGSLVTAAIFSASGMQWPSSDQFRRAVYPELRKLITTTDLFTVSGVGWSGLARYNARLLFARASVLADLLKRRWGVTGYLRDLPSRPGWLINATCIETGKNWRFGKREMGDWRFGRHYDPPFLMAEAAAASAAVPYAIGALTLKLPKEGWYRTDPATRKPVERSEPPAKRVRLWDGGAYENLGLEALFKPQRPLIGCNFLICSDASGPLPPARRFPLLGLVRGHLASPRLFDIASEQIRSLRSRMLVDALERGDVEGVLLRMGNSVRDLDLKTGRTREAEQYDHFQEDRETLLALRHPTDLKAIPKALFDRIARHGYEIADATLTAYASKQFTRALEWA